MDVISNSKSDERYRFDMVVIGGGIAGISCVDHFVLINPKATILLISSSDVVKTVSNLEKLTDNLESFTVDENKTIWLETKYLNLNVIIDLVVHVDPEEKRIKLCGGGVVEFSALCVCSGGSANVISQSNPRVLGIRDTQSVTHFQKQLKTAKRVMIVGNGGIATELIYGIEGCDIVWAIKDSAIGKVFFDASAAKFFMPLLNKKKNTVESLSKRLVYSVGDYQVNKDRLSEGCALGPDWSRHLSFNREHDEHAGTVQVEYECEVEAIFSSEEYFTLQANPEKQSDPDFPIYVKLTNGRIHGCDFVVSATGIKPSSRFIDVAKTDEGYINVDDKLQTSCPGIFAAGDVCRTTWKHSDLWFQMRLWSQARRMGQYSAICADAYLAGTLADVTLDFSFELFTHVTKFFGFQVVLLGQYNGECSQGDNAGANELKELLVRCTPGKEYVKVYTVDGRVKGVVLIGETGLEELFENLILNQIDVSQFKESLIDPNVDIEDYFD